jgi:hypothetical protein
LYQPSSVDGCTLALTGKSAMMKAMLPMMAGLACRIRPEVVKMMPGFETFWDYVNYCPEQIPPPELPSSMNPQFPSIFYDLRLPMFSSQQQNMNSRNFLTFTGDGWDPETRSLDLAYSLLHSEYTRIHGQGSF